MNPEASRAVPCCAASSGCNVRLCLAWHLFTPNMERSEKESRSDEEADIEEEEVDPRIQVGRTNNCIPPVSIQMVKIH